MSFIKSRLRRVEGKARRGPGARCPECGLRPQDKGYIVLDDRVLGEVRDPVPALPETCPGCGRGTRMRIVVAWDSEADEEIGEGGGGYRWP